MTTLPTSPTAKIYSLTDNDHLLKIVNLLPDIIKGEVTDGNNANLKEVSLDEKNLKGYYVLSFRSSYKNEGDIQKQIDIGKTSLSKDANSFNLKDTSLTIIPTSEHPYLSVGFWLKKDEESPNLLVGARHFPENLCPTNDKSEIMRAWGLLENTNKEVFLPILDILRKKGK